MVGCVSNAADKLCKPRAGRDEIFVRDVSDRLPLLGQHPERGVDEIVRESFISESLLETSQQVERSQQLKIETDEL